MCLGFTLISIPPLSLSLYSRYVKNLCHASFKIERFNPDLALTLVPGLAIVPLADLLMFLIGREQNTTFITEPQLYFVMMRSRTKIARQFRQWIVKEVLPALRKHGHYEVVKRDKENDLTDKEIQLIKDFLYRMTNFVGYTQSYINACWYAIRQTTGVKSPGKFRHTEIPVIMEELKRICFITECYNNARREAEEALFKKIIRKKGSFKELTDILGTMVTRSVDDGDLAKIQKLDRRNVDQDIQKLQQQIGA